MTMQEYEAMVSELNAADARGLIAAMKNTTSRLALWSNMLARSEAASSAKREVGLDIGDELCRRMNERRRQVRWLSAWKRRIEERMREVSENPPTPPRMTIESKRQIEDQLNGGCR